MERENCRRPSSKPARSRSRKPGAVLEDEMFIGGIYVRLFLKNPQYNIRKPA